MKLLMIGNIMPKARYLRVTRRIGLVLAMLISLTACGAGSIKWKEEVQLSDSKIIVVEREVLYESGGGEWASNPSGSKPKTYCIQFEYPIASKKIVKWCSTKIDDGRWPEIPLVLDIKADQPFVFTLVATSNCCEVYTKYVYNNGTWVEEPLPELFEQHTTNLLFASKKNLPAVLKLAEKNKRNDDTGHRRALYQVGPNRKVTFP